MFCQLKAKVFRGHLAREFVGRTQPARDLNIHNLITVYFIKLWSNHDELLCKKPACHTQILANIVQ